ncbi:PREDICTED: LOW QUALITY PROTEIN: UBX domain-containing protein 1-like [Prunus mume]|uniref:LOW QUALITY PROTEIN: UBX domain-containing protein 1-like n=1 Tax=Prunus mume TaxID=102107 RepID=A0ABM1LT05_PRUMU|nr:PREDICTED: LOW QUALITY PROTEIN: UBX domain-containing protein 1-like [Prunus mume]
MAVPEVDKKIIGELEAMGFPRPRATGALHYSGNASLGAAIGWIVDHENDADMDEMPLKIISSGISWRIYSQLVNYSQERIQSGKQLIEAKRSLEENERKRNIEFRKPEKEEEKRARERIRRKLKQDKLERRVNLGLPPEQLVAEKRTPAVRIEQNPFPVRSVAKSERLRECLRSLRRNHKDDDARVRQAFQTLLIYVGNVARNPNEEKFRKIRLSNPLFLDRVGSLIGGIEFLELCGFETTEGGEFLYLPHNKVDMATLNSAASELKSALINPFFGLL